MPNCYLGCGNAATIPITRRGVTMHLCIKCGMEYARGEAAVTRIMKMWARGARA